jgi:HemY protein
MRRILWIIVVCALVLAAAWLVAGLPGHVTAEFGDTTVEAATPVVAFALIVLLVVVYVVVRLFAALIGIPGRTGRWRNARRHRAGETAVTRTLLALAAGDKGDARRESSRARRLLGDSPQTLLLTAEAGRLAGREDEAETAFRALTERQDAAFLGYRGLLRQAIGRQNWSEAATLARQAEAVHPGAAWLRQERSQLAIRAGHWAEALDLAEAGTPKAALATAAAQAETDPSKALQLARRAWRDDPSLAPAAVAYAERLRAAGKEKRAQRVLSHSWSIAPHPDLAACALAPVSDTMARVKAAQALTAANPSHVESRLLLAGTALAAGLTGEARHQAEAARAAGFNQRRLWLLLAEIEEEERCDTEAGRLAQRDALRRAASADPDPGWRCQSCHTPHDVWHPACPACGAAGSVRWFGAERPVASSVPAVI